MSIKIPDPINSFLRHVYNVSIRRAAILLQTFETLTNMTPQPNFLKSNNWRYRLHALLVGPMLSLILIHSYHQFEL
jgi:hypothetical protein